MDRLTIKAGGRVVRLRWDLKAWLELEDGGYSIGRVLAETQSETPHRAWLAFMAAMANSGARHAGEPADVTAGWLAEHLTTTQMREAEAACTLAYLLGNRRQNAEDDDTEVDAVLEELKKKRDAAREQETV